VLGAGASRRLGRPKQTLPLGDTTLLGWVVRDVAASSLDRIVLVVGGAAEEALATLPPTRAEVVSNEAYPTGCASSLLAGLDACAAGGDVDAIMLLLGDMPGVGPAVVDGVRAEWEAHRPWAAVTSWRGTPGHPFVFSAGAFPTLRGVHGDKAVWKILDAQPERVRPIPVDADLPPDVDTWEDYEEVRRRLGLAGPAARETTAASASSDASEWPSTNSST
jgi:molybdenum cofactor cytidylyltransferase